MSTDSHDGGERLAPVIPLFGAATTAEPTWRSTWDEDVESSSPDASSSAAARVDDDGRSVDAAAVENLVLKKLRA
ncbi:MAG: hypothetical protein J0I66_07670, partial [Microbacterium sp.]|nr:hypothetical protein [Microbacterium sp.]